MGLDTCSTHGVKATHRCPICHKPLCDRCQGPSGTCSERCYKARLAFGGPVSRVPRKRGWGWIWTLIHTAIVLGIAYAVCRYFQVDPVALIKRLLPT